MASWGLLMAAGFGLTLFLCRIPPGRALVAPSPCPGNVCVGNFVVGGQNVQYAYTQHIRPDGRLKIRLNGGVYNTSNLVSFILHDLPAFVSWDKYANPNNGAVYLPEEDISPGLTAYERRDVDGCASCIVDQVMMVDFSGLAEGAYSFSLTVIQNGDSGGQSGLPFYVDTAAPSNGDESETWAALAGMDLPCADSFDNDLDYGTDCADGQCDGSVGRVADGALCEVPEQTCHDEFDNDADGDTDCLDADCDGRVGGTAPAYVPDVYCQFGNEWGPVSCTDNFDNDGDSDAVNPARFDCQDNLSNPPGNPALTCWKQPAYGCPATEDCVTAADDDVDRNFSDDYDAVTTTGVNCTDYDCAGRPECPSHENRTAAGDDADEQCFDTYDNDLDGDVDCADPDCLGVVNPLNPNQMCYEKEFDLGERYQFCDNSFDDDGDDPVDCDDSDCSQKFLRCGPCPSIEHYKYHSCSDGDDNDTDAATDCSDVDCIGRLGEIVVGAARCAVTESSDAACGDIICSDVMCGDGFDNDLDGSIDCQDPNCATFSHGRGGHVCEPAGESSCGDGGDNDGDGSIDCLDDDCFGVGGCAPKNWLNASCITVPRYSPATPFTSNDPTVMATVSEAAHVSGTDTIDLSGSANYSSFTVVVGDAMDPAGAYPYASNLCSLTDVSGSEAAKLGLTVVAGKAVQVYNLPAAGPLLGNFTVRLSCPTPAVPAAEITYPISISVLKLPGDIPEYGDATFRHTLFEATPPDVLTVEAEGEVAGTVELPYLDGRRFRAIPNDPGAAPFSSGICYCRVSVDGTPYMSAGGDCLTSPVEFDRDGNVIVEAFAEDGANNIGPLSAPVIYSVNVTPTINPADPQLNRLRLTAPVTPFLRSGEMDISLRAEFRTGFGDDFYGLGSSCDVFVYGSDGAIVNGPVGPTDSFAGFPTPDGVIACNGGITLPGGVPDGEYFVAIRVTDSDLDSAFSNRVPLYVCKTVPTANTEPLEVCGWADFDGDDATEGLYTDLYSTVDRPCDNCVGLANANQRDANANGVGDVCEPDNEEYGRCEIDRDIVCKWDANDAVNCPGDYCCPQPSNTLVEVPPGSENYEHIYDQRCIDSWGLCTIDGSVCFDDDECEETVGTCAVTATECERDLDCSGDPGDICVGADICENMLFPWLQTVHGNIFSLKNVFALDEPPENEFNATYCITAKDLIYNFRSELCATEPQATTVITRPTPANAYATVLGRIDVEGIVAGEYGDVQDGNGGTDVLSDLLHSLADRLDGRVFLVDDGSDAHLDSHEFKNSLSDDISGAGTIVIKGGDLYLNGDITYQSTTVTSLNRLASVGWIVLPAADGSKGNIYIDGNVSNLVGAFFAGGDDGVHTVAPPATDSDTPLTVHGLMIARKFHLSRTFKSASQGSERIIYDGRAVANPPPGFGDVTKWLPTFNFTISP